MAFAEHREALASDLGRLHDMLRQAQDLSRSVEERATLAAAETETLADDTALARVLSAAKKARQDLGALMRATRDARDGL